jgi:hypothetical protein
MLYSIKRHLTPRPHSAVWNLSFKLVINLINRHILRILLQISLRNRLSLVGQGNVLGFLNLNIFDPRGHTTAINELHICFGGQVSDMLTPARCTGSLPPHLVYPTFSSVLPIASTYDQTLCTCVSAGGLTIPVPRPAYSTRIH